MTSRLQFIKISSASIWGLLLGGGMAAFWLRERFEKIKIPVVY
jgi:hypothetical protein